MAKNKTKPQPSTPAVAPPATPTDGSHAHGPGHSITREVFESLAVALMLALFIRTFVAEPFVIPTGSMAPTLMGAHKDLLCPQCGQRFRVNASTDGAPTANEARARQCVAGMCNMCRYTVPFHAELARLPNSPRTVVPTPTYNGDRIVVNKFLYSFTDPNRWDVVVFKFPGNASDNYIKRLVGLPNEVLGIYQGDLFVGEPSATRIEETTITSKSPTTVMAMRHPVHDTYCEAAVLHGSGWPLRWSNEGEAEGWKIDIDPRGNEVIQRFATQGDGEQWLRYRHFVPTQRDWQALERGETPQPRVKLVDDFQSYNASVTQRGLYENSTNPFHISAANQGIHWVGDLMVEANVTTESTEGELLLEVVESGHRFRAIVDLATATARLEVLPWEAEEPVALASGGKTPLATPGDHHLIFANVDDQLHLWVDDHLVTFDSSTRYDWDALFGPRRDNLPRTSDSDPGDLAPVGVASRGAAMSIERLRVWRDVYYIATKALGEGFDEDLQRAQGLFDYREWPDHDLLYDPRLWSALRQRESKLFPLGADQFFVLGDNSPASQDARLWFRDTSDAPNPGGNYLERHMLIGRAVGVVWPHTWNYIIPGISDMRLIR